MDGLIRNFLAALDNADSTRKRVVLLQSIGEFGCDIFDTLSDIGEAKEYEKAVKALSDHFISLKEYAVYLFRQARQREGETVDAYYTRS